MQRWGGELGKTGNRRLLPTISKLEKKKLLDMIKGKQAWGFLVRESTLGLARVQSGSVI